MSLPVPVHIVVYFFFLLKLALKFRIFSTVIINYSHYFSLRMLKIRSGVIVTPLTPI